jgi:hypothetical protein
MGNGNWKRTGSGDNNDLFITFFVLFCTISPCGMCSIYVYPVSAMDVYVTIEKIPLRKIEYKFIRLFSNRKEFNSMVG